MSDFNRKYRLKPVVVGNSPIEERNPKEPSAVIQIDDPNGGFLTARMTTAQRDAIVQPATGLMIFNTDTSAMEVYDQGSTSWGNSAFGGGGGGGTITSVFGRTGTVVAASGDYNAGEITVTPAGNLAATDVQAALTELQGDIDTLGGITVVDTFNGRNGTVVPASGDYNAGEITVTPVGNLAATDVQAALAELQVDIDGINAATYVNSFNGRTGAVVPVAGDYQINDLSDVDTTTAAPSTNDVLQYNGTEWVPGTISVDDEVVENAGALSGAAPTGAHWGVDTTTGAAYYVSGGNWTAVPVATVDLNTFTNDASGNNIGVAPVASPASPDTGDVLVESYDDAIGWWVWNGAAWTLSFQSDATPTMTGATGAVAGTTGAVPTPAATDNVKFLRGDATWADAGKARVFADDTTVAPAATGAPTVAEIATFTTAGSHTDAVVYYTGSDTGTDVPTYTYWVDTAGDVTQLGSVITPLDRVFADDTTVAPATTSAPTVAEITTFTTAGSHIDTLVYYTGSDTGTDVPTYTYWVDGSGVVTELNNPLNGKDRAFADATTVAAVDVVNPTDSEIQAFATAQSLTDTLVYYTGTDTSTDATQYVYSVDQSGVITLIRTPANTIQQLGYGRLVHKGTDGAFAIPFTKGSQTFAGVDSVLRGMSATPATGSFTVQNAGEYQASFFLSANDIDNDTLWTLVVDGVDIESLNMQGTTNQEKDFFGQFQIVSLSAGQVVTIHADYSGGADDNITIDFGNATNTIMAFTLEQLATKTFIDPSLIPADITGVANEDGLIWNTANSQFEVGSILGADRVFADDTTVAPAAAGVPTTAEITTFTTAGSHIDTLVYYTGSDTSTDAPTYTYWVDKSGVVTPLGSSSVDGIDTVLAEGEALTAARTIDAATNDLTVDNAGTFRVNAATAYTLGDGAGANVPAKDSDSTDDLVSMDAATGVLGSMDADAFRVLSGAADPVDGTTAAWYANQKYINTTTGRVFYATAASTDPDAAATGSTWAAVTVATARVHADDTTVAPAATGAPTLVEITAFTTAGSHTDGLIYYTGDDLPASTPTHVYWVDTAGAVELLREPLPKTKHEETFNNTTDWGTAAAGLYTITVTAATHGITDPRIVQVWDESGPTLSLVQTEVSIVTATGDVSISIAEVPEGRFAGRVVIM